MSDEDTRIDELHRYLGGEMDAAESAAFEDRLQADPQLQADLQLERELQALLRYERKRQLKQMLRETRVDYEQPAEQDPSADESPIAPRSPKNRGGLRPPFLKYMYSIAAIAACLVAAVLVFKPFGGGNDFNSLVLESDERVITDGLRATGPIDQAYESLKLHDWSKALPLLDTVKVDTEKVLWRGICNLHLENWADARADFEKVEVLRDGDLSVKAAWYLALMDRKDARLDDCKRRLQVVVEAEGFMGVRAKELQVDLGFAD